MINAVVDVETVALPEAVDFLSADDPVEAPSHYKDQAKIDAYIAEKTGERLERAALDPDLCRLACIGWMFDGERPAVVTCPDEDYERMALETFWRSIESDDALQQTRLITFNGFRFDLLVLQRRSDYLGVKYRELNVDRYRSRHVDLFHRLTFGQAAGTKHSLRFYANRFGIPVRFPEVDGSKIGELAAASDWTAIMLHCEDDILITAEIARRVGVLQTWPTTASA